MATELKSPVDVDLSTSQRSLLLVWQSPASRRFVKVGRLDLLAGNKFAFRYLPDDASDAEFFELDDYPERDRAVGRPFHQPILCIGHQPQRRS